MKILTKQMRSCINCCKSFGTLATVFNARPLSKVSQRLVEENQGLFGISELTSYNGLHILKDRCLSDTESLINEAVSPSRSRKIVEVFDELSNTLCKVADLAEFIRVAHPSSSYTQSAQIACTAVSSVVEKLNTNLKLYKSLKETIVNGDIIPTNKVDNHVANLFLHDFEQSGIHLSEPERQKVVVLMDNILHLGQQFVVGSTSPRFAKRSLVPESIRCLFPSDDENIIVYGLCGESPNPLAREVAYKIFLYPEDRQDQLLTKLLLSRDELAKVCGFRTYAERALRKSMVESPSGAIDFLNVLSNCLRPYADMDFEVMNKLKKIESPDFGAVAVWDVPYFTMKLRKEKFKVTASDYSPYFSLGACMEGLSNLFRQLYRIELVSVDVGKGETWSPDVYKIAVVHETEGTLGHIYCDFFERQGKPNQDCHFTIRAGKLLPDGSYQQPIVVLMLNIPQPSFARPSLLSPGMVDNLFHEMGHAMHSMLARTHYQHVAGTRCSTDFAEVPSVLMEYFASDPRVLRTFTKHFRTEEPMPEELLRRLCASKKLFTASETQAQLFYSVLDQVYHGEHPLKGTTTEVLAEIQPKYYSLPYVPNTSWQLRFGHLVGYGAKYYAYLVSKAVASRIWQRYFEADPFNGEQGERYRRECLAHGGGKPPRQLVADFLREEPTPDLLAESLVKEIDADRNFVGQM